MKARSYRGVIISNFRFKTTVIKSEMLEAYRSYSVTTFSNSHRHRSKNSRPVVMFPILKFCFVRLVVSAVLLMSAVGSRSRRQFRFVPSFISLLKCVKNYTSGKI